MAASSSRWLARRRADLLATAGYLLGACLLFAHLLTGVRTHYLVHSVTDQNLLEWFFAATAHALASGHNPLAVDLVNAPLGANGMANTTVLGLSVPLAPVTLLFGPEVSFTVAMVGGIAATATAWYWLFSRHVAPSRIGAFLAGALCSFSPAMVAQANGHVQMPVHFAVPLLIGFVLRMDGTGQVLREALPVGLCAAYQVFVGEEILLIAAMGFSTFLVLLGVQRPSVVRERLRRFLPRIAAAAGIALAVTAYPLWYQFNGPMHYDGLPSAKVLSIDAASFFTFSSQSLAGRADAASLYTFDSHTEENTFFGWPLILLTALVLLWLIRSAAVRSAAVTAAVFCSLALGDRVWFRREDTGITGPRYYLAKLPFFGDVIVSRYSFVAVPMIALILVLATDRVLRCARRAGSTTGGALQRIAWFAALAAALVPLAPKPLPAVDRQPVPRFFTAGTWQRYLGPGETLVSVPLPHTGRGWERDWAMTWQIATGMRFRVAAGYFVGPLPADEWGPDGHGGYGAPHRPTTALFVQVATTGEVPAIGQAERAAFTEDMAYWQSHVLVLDPATAPHAERLRAAVDALSGSDPTAVDGVWVWTV